MMIASSVLTTLSWVLPVLVVLTLLVFFHELGHYLLARWNGVRVEVFSIGFGPELFGWTDGRKTRWKVGLIPLGGYVRMFGDADAASSVDFEKIQSLSPEEKKETLAWKTVSQRMAVVSAGPLANILITVLCFWIVMFSIGEPRLDGTIGAMDPEGPASQAGLQSGDRIRRIDGEVIEDFQSLRRIISKKASQVVTLTYERDGHKFDAVVRPMDMEGHGIIGVMPYREKRTLWGAFKGAVFGTGVATAHMLETFWCFVTGQENPNKLGGLGSIAKMAKESWEEGIIALIGFMGLLSLNLGILNFFPIPVLDGGHLLFYGIEALRGKPVSQTLQEYAYKAGFFVIVVLMVYSHWNDLVRFHLFQTVGSFLARLF